MKLLNSGAAILAFLSLLSFALGASAAPAPALAGNLPVYIQIGESRELTLSGQNLSAAASVVVAGDKDVEAVLIKPEKPADNQARLKITARASAEPGEREIRIVSPGGVSNALMVAVGAYPLIAEVEPNNTRDEAQSIVLPAVIVGRIEGAGDVDQFKFVAQRGQHLLFNARIGRLGSPLEPVMIVHEAATGREFATGIEQHSGDALIVFDPPADGSYTLEVRDLRYRGGPDFNYRIEAGVIPFLEAVFPMSAPRGKVVQLQAIGHNLQGGETIAADLTAAQLGTIRIRAHTPLGFSNDVALEVTDAPAQISAPRNLTLQSPALIPLPANVSGRLDQPGEEDFFRFHVSQKQPINIAIAARAISSPLDTLLALRNGNGDVIEMNNGAGGADASIRRELDAGDYIASLRDLAYRGGPNFLYRLQVGNDASATSFGSFSFRFLPDAIRLRRGGFATLWCECIRPPGFKGEVTVQLDGLPAGVTSPPAMIAEPGSGLFTISAGPDAVLGTLPVRLTATVTANGRASTFVADPEINGRAERQAYLTVLDAAPFTIEPLLFSPQRLAAMEAELSQLNVQLSATDPHRDEAQLQWEKNVLAKPAWTVIDPTTLASAAGAVLSKKPDGSILASGAVPAKETYTLTAKTSLKGITAFRLEALADPSLPANGPGAAPNGNFVLDEFKITQAQPNKPAQPVVLKLATADFSQASFPVQNAIDNNPGTGWAISPEFGKDHAAVFTTAAPAGFDGETTLTFVLEHQSQYAQHNIGHFRISATTADPASLPQQSLPEPILAVLRIPVEQRSPQQREQVAAYFREIDPMSASRRARLQSLQQLLAPAHELQQVEATLAAATPQLGDEQSKWEQTPAAQSPPVPPNIVAIVKTPATARNEQQKNDLSAYFRSIAPSLQPKRDRAAQLRAQLDPKGFVATRGKAAGIPFALIRRPDFKGDVQITLEGFSSGRDAATRSPTPIAKNLKFTPLTLSGDVSIGTLSFTPEGNSEVGARAVALSATTPLGGETIAQNSAAFVLTINEK